MPFKNSKQTNTDEDFKTKAASEQEETSPQADGTFVSPGNQRPNLNPHNIKADHVLQLQRTFGNRFVGNLINNKTRGRAANAVQRVAEDIDQQDELTVKDRAQTRTNSQPSEEEIKGYGPNQKANALVVRGGSMAQDPEFEKEAIKWEARFGGVAYNDDRAKKVVDDGAKKAVDYLTKKANSWDSGNQELQKELAKVQITDTGWSGGVGQVTEKIMGAFTDGPLGVKIAHLENFCNKILANDLLSRDEKGLEELLDSAAIDKDSDELQDAKERIKNKNSVYALHDVKGPAADQWHMRASRNPNDKSENISKRTVKEVEEQGVKLHDDEKSFMGLKDETDTVKWAEGARIWALNERDKWVYAMRQLSLPLAAGVSGTTARMMQSFSILGVGNPADNRLACIAYLLPTRHHSLCEIMEGAAGNGGPAFTAAHDMYSKIEPYTPEELRNTVGAFPHEVMQSKNLNVVN